MEVLKLQREPGDERTGVFTSGIVSTGQGQKIALYFTGRQHAGENMAHVLKQRAKDLSPAIQMCDALSRNVPKFPSGVEILVSNCLAHGRRQFVEVVQNFPEECRHVLEMLGEVYRYDTEARDGALTAEERLRFHQEHSGPVMEKLHGWLEAQFAERKTEPNSSLGKAITYLLRHWKALTTFLREAGAPLDNNICTAARGSDQIMPTPGLCRVGLRNDVGGERSLIFGGWLVGIITGSPRRRATDLAAGSGQVRGRMKSRGRVRVPLAACPRVSRSGSFLSIRGRARERSR